MSDSGFVIREREGLHYPCLICESCGELIDNYKMAGVVWDHGTAGVGEARCRVTVLCKKNGCLGKEPYRGKPWQEMRDYLLWLGYNSGIKTEAELREAWEFAEGMVSI